LPLVDARARLTLWVRRGARCRRGRQLTGPRTSTPGRPLGIAREDPPGRTRGRCFFCVDSRQVCRRIDKGRARRVPFPPSKMRRLTCIPKQEAGLFAPARGCKVSVCPCHGKKRSPPHRRGILTAVTHRVGAAGSVVGPLFHDDDVLTRRGQRYHGRSSSSPGLVSAPPAFLLQSCCPVRSSSAEHLAAPFPTRPFPCGRASICVLELQAEPGTSVFLQNPSPTTPTATAFPGSEWRGSWLAHRELPAPSVGLPIGREDGR